MSTGPERADRPPKSWWPLPRAALAVLLLLPLVLLFLLPAILPASFHITVINESGARADADLSLCDTFDCNVYWRQSSTLDDGRSVGFVVSSCKRGGNVLFVTSANLREAEVVRCGDGQGAIEVHIEIGRVRIAQLAP